MVNLILIPARKGSVGIKNKNIRIFCGMPLIEHTLRECKKIRRKDMIVLVSSDCSKTLKIAKKYNFHHGYRRPKYLSTNKSNITQATFHAVKWIEKNKNCEVDNIILLQPTSPFRRYSEVTMALEIFIKKKISKFSECFPCDTESLRDGKYIK